MNQQDAAANIVTLGGLGLTLADFQSLLTITVLVSALILNIVRIRSAKKKDEN